MLWSQCEAVWECAEPNTNITHVWEALVISESHDLRLLGAGECKGEKDLEREAGRSSQVRKGKVATDNTVVDGQ